jgi:hypothetical protein
MSLANDTDRVAKKIRSDQGFELILAEDFSHRSPRPVARRTRTGLVLVPGPAHKSCADRASGMHDLRKVRIASAERERELSITKDHA